VPSGWNLVSGSLPLFLCSKKGKTIMNVLSMQASHLKHLLGQRKNSVPLAVFVFTIRGDGDLARALREGDNDRDRSLGVGDGSRLQQIGRAYQH
jgi:hypothetical protein